MAQHMPSGQFEGYQEHLIYGRPDQQNMQNDIQHSNSRRLFVLMIFTFVFCIISNLYLFYDRSNLRSQMYDLQQQIDNLENKMVVKSDNTIAANITTHHDTILDMQRLQNESSSGQNKNSKQNCTYSANSVRNINISALQTQVKVINESVTHAFFNLWSSQELDSADSTAVEGIYKEMQIDLLGGDSLEEIKSAHDKVVQAVYSIPPHIRERYQTHPLIYITKDNAAKAKHLLIKK
eukprot:20398_1